MGGRGGEVKLLLEVTSPSVDTTSHHHPKSIELKSED